MFVLQLPNKPTETIDGMFTKLWWGENEEKKKIHMIKWSELCKPINEGGLGIRHTKSKNLALLAKTCRRCLNSNDLLCTKNLKPKYCPNKSLWEAIY